MDREKKNEVNRAFLSGANKKYICLQTKKENRFCGAVIQRNVCLLDTPDSLLNEIYF